MKKRISVVLLVLINVILYAQEESDKRYSFDVNNFYGTVLKHNPDISHLITGHPSGVIISVNKKTFGKKEWERLYNYPEYGVSFLYQEMDNGILGEHYGLYGHYSFYFLKRNLMFRIGTGISYNTNPYDEDDNFRNVAYGSHLLSGTFLMLNYKKENIIGGLGLQAGISLVHYSNGNSKSPNTSTNTMAVNVGVNYQLSPNKNEPEYITKEEGLVKAKEPFGFGLYLRSGVNQNGLIGSGQYPFLTVGAFVDKRLNKKSAVQLGTELFLSRALERYIDYRAVGGFNDGTIGDEDAKRVGVYVGHELRINKVAIIVQVGMYVYYPYDFEGRLYDRLGLQYYFNKNIFGGISVKAHAAKAENAEFTLGYRF